MTLEGENMADNKSGGKGSGGKGYRCTVCKADR